MTARQCPFWNRTLPRIRFILLLAALTAPWTVLHAGDNLKVEAKLIWGTNDEKSPNPKHKPLDTELTEDLRRIFKWKNYFEVNSQTNAVPLKAPPKKISMSEKCYIEVKNLGEKVEVKLYGENNLLSTTRETRQKLTDKWLTLAGPDKNNTAWFVVIRAADAK